MSTSRARTERSVVKEVVAFGLLAVGVLVALSLVTYDPSDPAFNVASDREEVANWAGWAGALMADLLLQGLGLLAFVLPAALLALGGRGMATGRLGVAPRFAAGILAALVSLGGLAAILPSIPVYFLANASSTSGLVGLLVARAFVAVFNSIGAGIVLSCLLVVTTMLTLRISLFDLFRNMGVDGSNKKDRASGTPAGLSGIRDRLSAWWAERKAARAAARRVEEEQRELARDLSEGDLDRERAARRAAEEKVREDLLDTSDRPTVRPVRGTRRADDGDLREEAEERPSVPVHLPRTDRLTPVAEAPPVEEPPPIPLSASAAAKAKVAEYRGRQRTAAAAADGNGASVLGSAHPAAPPPAELDPDVVEMVSTASIVRAEPVRAAAARKPIQVVSTDTGYSLPSTELLAAAPAHSEQGEKELELRAITLAEKCKEFSVTGHIHRINPGPVVTTFEFKPDAGVKYSRIVSLADDLCLALKAESIRIDRIPGKSTVGIEVPNENRATIYLRDIIESEAFQQSTSKLTLALGQTIEGQEYIQDLQRMPHLLIAGSTGSGKSVMVNTIVTSILYKAAPDEVKFILVDPKRVELGLYEGIPHLLTPIIVDPKRAANALKWAVGEMENRYRTLAGYGVRNIEQYNREVRAIVNQRLAEDSEELPKPLPYIVVLIDELADLMMVASSEVEASITRLAQMARAVGIHLVLATQRPSVDVITGLIKANFPSRMSFRVSSKVDSRTIIDTNGAEQLLGQGDMLFLPPGTSRLVRVHGSFMSEGDVKNITSFIKQQGEPNYDTTVTMSAQEADGIEGGGEQDELFADALKIVCDMGRASTSVLQRRLRIGYGRAAAILDQMEQAGFVGPQDGSRPRVVLPLAYEFRERNAQIIEERDGSVDD
jgi:DNA segregation ATPase FtsK/SpoIIIE, S-DNA-T family